MPALPTRTSSRWYRSLRASCESRDAITILDIEWHQRSGAAGRLDFVVELFQSTDSSRHGHHMRASHAQFKRIAAPMPREAPVTSAIRSERGLRIIGHSCQAGLVPAIHVFLICYGRV